MTVVDSSPSTGVLRDPQELLSHFHLAVQRGTMAWDRPVNRMSAYALAQLFYKASDPVWFGPLEQYMRTMPDVTDIFVDGPLFPVYYDERGLKRTGFMLHEFWIQYVQWMLLFTSGRADPSLPNQQFPPSPNLGTAELRYRYVLGRPPDNPYGSSVNVRVLPKKWPTLEDIIRQGQIPREAAALLVDALKNHFSIIVAGGTGSGKTTFVNALLQEIDDARIVFVEEASELPRRSYSHHWEVTGAVDAHGQVKDASAFVKVALRLKPHYLVVGEVRGAEAYAMLHGMTTGHPGVGTLHASDAQTALRNLERYASLQGTIEPKAIRGMIASRDNPFLVVHISRFADGKRRMTALEEVAPSGATGGAGEAYPTNKIWGYDPKTGEIRRMGGNIFHESLAGKY